MSSAAISALKRAIKGLFYMSEKDAPFLPLTWAEKTKPTKKKILEMGGHPPDSPVEQVKLEDFFAGPTSAQTWHGKQEKAAVKKYQALLASIQDNLTEVKVYKVGEARKTIYILGKTANGVWTGLETAALET